MNNKKKNQFNTQPVYVDCSYCSKSKRISPSRLNLYKNHFCNVKCKQKWQIKNKTMSGDKSPMKRKDVIEQFIGKNNSSWKGERYKSLGYTYILKKDHPRVKNKEKKYVAEHILIMEKYLGRYLNKNEQIHHINGKKDDNNINNLIVLTIDSHSKYHSKFKIRDSYGRFI